ERRCKGEYKRNCEERSDEAISNLSNPNNLTNSYLLLILRRNKNYK
ncbi:unnamed protein product, partial [marine sediment metagenome]